VSNQQGTIIFINGPESGKEIQLSNDKGYMIGRTEEVEIVLNAKGISRKHAQIVYDDKCWKIIDLASRNGIKVNGSKKDEAILSDGDVISIGTAKLKYVVPGENNPETLAVEPAAEDDNQHVPLFHAGSSAPPPPQEDNKLSIEDEMIADEKKEIEVKEQEQLVYKAKEEVPAEYLPDPEYYIAPEIKAEKKEEAKPDKFPWHVFGLFLIVLVLGLVVIWRVLAPEKIKPFERYDKYYMGNEYLVDTFDTGTYDKPKLVIHRPDVIKSSKESIATIKKTKNNFIFKLKAKKPGNVDILLYKNIKDQPGKVRHLGTIRILVLENNNNINPWSDPQVSKEERIAKAQELYTEGNQLFDSDITSAYKKYIEAQKWLDPLPISKLKNNIDDKVFEAEKLIEKEHKSYKDGFQKYWKVRQYAHCLKALDGIILLYPDHLNENNQKARIFKKICMWNLKKNMKPTRRRRGLFK